MKKQPTIFTPNTKRAGPNRYRLYRHGESVFSVTPRGKQFEADVERDACGLGCVCGAYITPRTETGKAILATATQIDSASQPIRCAS